MNSGEIQTDKHSIYTDISEEIKIKYIAFSPEIDSLAMVKDLISSASKSIVVVHAFFCQEEIRRSLLAAKKRGVDITILVNHSFDMFTRVLAADGFRIMVVKKLNSLMHYKTILADGHLVLTGSLNLFYKSMCKDREMFMLIDSEFLCRAIFAETEKIWVNDKYIIMPEAADLYLIVKYYVISLLRKIKRYLAEIFA